MAATSTLFFDVAQRAFLAINVEQNDAVMTGVRDVEPLACVMYLQLDCGVRSVIRFRHGRDSLRFGKRAGRRVVRVDVDGRGLLIQDVGKLSVRTEQHLARRRSRPRVHKGRSRRAQLAGLSVERKLHHLIRGGIADEGELARRSSVTEAALAPLTISVAPPS